MVIGDASMSVVEITISGQLIFSRSGGETTSHADTDTVDKVWSGD